MPIKSSRAGIAVTAALVTFVLARATAPAGTTGALNGIVLDVTSNKPIAEVSVTIVSPSQKATTTTDATGRFVVLSLPPDTYDVALAKSGFEPVSYAGITVYADQSQSLTLDMHPSIKTIATVKSRSPMDLVKAGTTSDVYSVSPAVQAAAAPVGGGGLLNSAYSALTTSPGVYIPVNQVGIDQTVYVRGGFFNQLGYEFDGVPVNRSFDNYPGDSASTLGQQELQVYVGGATETASATGMAGFINQVIKTGTFPGYADISGGMGTNAFYHSVSAEAGGATPDRLFSYYAGISGFNQAYRYFDQQNGASLLDIMPNTAADDNTVLLDFLPAVYPTCNANLSNPFTTGQIKPPSFANNPGCFASVNPVYGAPAMTYGRDAIANLHFGIAHKNDSGRDDVQMLYDNSARYRQFYSGVDDVGQITVDNPVIGGARWPDYLTYPSGTQFFAPASIAPIAYLFPGSPTDRCANVSLPIPDACTTTAAALPNDYRDGRWDTSSVVKLQYQKNIGSRAYFRVFGYTFFSNSIRSGASGFGIGPGFGTESYDYEVNSHTRGLQMQYENQVDNHNLLTGTFNYVTATTDRLNNTNYHNTPGFAVSNLTNGTQCFAAVSGTGSNGVDTYTAGQPAPCNDPITEGSFSNPTQSQNVNCSGGANPIPAPACAAGASWRLTYTGNQGAINDVTPEFASIALGDQWVPSDKLNVNLGLRFERDQYNLTPADAPGQSFWFAAAQREYCYNPVTLQPVIVPQPPQLIFIETPYVSFNCPVDKSTGVPVQTVHPDGKDGHLLLTNVFDPVIAQNYTEPRFGITYTVTPDTVLRGSAGTYVQQPQAYQIEYNSLQQNLARQLIGFLPYGFTTPRHDVLPQYSYNYDLSYERHFKGTDMSMKVSPYYRLSMNQLYSTSVIGNSASFNSGVERSYGAEFEFTKGDFTRNGFSGQLSYTALNSKERWANFQNTNQNPVDIYNNYIQEYNALTRAGGGAPCYANTANDTPAPSCPATSIRNPYYASAPQPLLDPNGWYQTGLDYPYLSPQTFALLLNYRHNKFAVTPTMTLQAGSWYGNPADVIGVDPRTCTKNNMASGLPSSDPLRADYTSCASAATPSGELYVPNPKTGTFDSFGAFQQPWDLNLGLQLTYDLNSKIKVNLVFANLLNRCFGGSSESWTSAVPPSADVCAYSDNFYYISNFYNGSGPNDVAANGVPLKSYFEQPFVPYYSDGYSYSNYVQAFNVYLQLSAKL